ncbi:hypothetical protein F5B19DRAFT_499420 [Rostrohypoxylon terebratum]|nr:hypothetical protein F5B19DRAFT_499420 [Rostrohypoxylon terebratum]
MPKHRRESSEEDVCDNDVPANKKRNGKAKKPPKLSGWQTRTNKTAQCDECWHQHQSCTGWRCERCAKGRLQCTRSSDGVSCEECIDVKEKCSGVRDKCRRCDGLKRKDCVHKRVRMPDPDHILATAMRIDPEIEKKIIVALRTTMKPDEGEGGQAEVTGEQYLLQADNDRRKALRKKWKATKLYKFIYEGEEPELDNTLLAAPFGYQPHYGHSSSQYTMTPNPMQYFPGVAMNAEPQHLPMAANPHMNPMSSHQPSYSNHSSINPSQISRPDRKLTQVWHQGPPSIYQ